MPYKDKKIQSQKQAEYYRIKRNKWITENGPCKKCGSFQNLEVDHIEPSTKVSHKIWFWSEKRRLQELEKCQVLCNRCHKLKTREYYFSKRVHGLSNTYKLGCRCLLCTLAVKEYQRKYRLKLKN